MSSPFSTNLARVLELVADQATSPLTPDEHQEMVRLMGQLNLEEQQIARLEKERSEKAASLALALMMQRDTKAPLPPGLRDKLLASAMAELGSSTAMRDGAHQATSYRPGPSRFAIYAGWIVAAAAIALAAVVYFNRPKSLVTPPTPTIVAQAAELARQPETITAAWGAGPDKQGADIAGQTLWNNKTQKGFLRLKGLARNDPAKTQYQLWIFDKGRSEPGEDLLKQSPIDAGVFDLAEAHLDPASGEYIVPIHAKLIVKDPGAFAITSEVPGGVVVSKREHLLGVAIPKS